MCQNTKCPFSYKRFGAKGEAAYRFQKKIYWRAMAGKGRLHPAVEKALKDRGFNAPIGGMQKNKKERYT